MVASVTCRVVALPPRSGVCSDGSAVTFSIARMSRSAAGRLAEMLQHHRVADQNVRDRDWRCPCR